MVAEGKSRVIQGNRGKSRVVGVKIRVDPTGSHQIALNRSGSDRIRREIDPQMQDREWKQSEVGRKKVQKAQKGKLILQEVAKEREGWASSICEFRG